MEVIAEGVDGDGFIGGISDNDFEGGGAIGQSGFGNVVKSGLLAILRLVSF